MASSALTANVADVDPAGTVTFLMPLDASSRAEGEPPGTFSVVVLSALASPFTDRSTVRSTPPTTSMTPEPSPDSDSNEATAGAWTVTGRTLTGEVTVAPPPLPPSRAQVRDPCANRSASAVVRLNVTVNVFDSPAFLKASFEGLTVTSTPGTSADAV